MRVFFYCLCLCLTSTATASDMEQCGEHLFSALLSAEEIESTLSEYCKSQGFKLSETESDLLENIHIYEDETLDRGYAIQNFLAVSKKEIHKNTLNYSSVSNLLQQLDLNKEEAPLSLWERFLDWLKSHNKDISKDNYKWLDDFIAWLNDLNIPDWFATVLFRGSILLLIIMAIVFVINELNQNGLFRKKRKQHSSNIQNMDSFNNPDRKQDWKSIQSQPPNIRFRAMFAYLLNRLIKLDHLPNNPSLTNHELASHLKAQHYSNSEKFHHMSLFYADYVYGSKEINESVVDILKQRISAIIETHE